MLLIPSAHSDVLLAPGDRMELDEFLQRWDQSPELKFAELIDGTVYMPSPVSLPHSRYDSSIQGIIGYYKIKSRICEGATNATWLMLGAAPQPDLALSLKSRYGGRRRLTGNLASGIPELIVEVCRSSRSYDLGPKLALYERAGVPEYLAILVEERRFEWRILSEGRYDFLRPANGVWKSRIFPGLWIDERAFWDDNDSQIEAVLEEGLRSLQLPPTLDDETSSPQS